MAGSLMNKVALISGASSGIGRASAVEFARAGAAVVLADVEDKGGEETVRLVRDAGGDARFVHADVSRRADVQRMVAAAVDAFGRLDCAFNNAGIEGTPAFTVDQTEENWDRIISVNLKGVWLAMKFEIAQMLQQGGGSIVNCSSVAGLVGFRASGPYVASKHGLIGLTKSAALEYADAGIRVNAVCPGVIQTPMIDRFTQGRDEALAQLVAMEPMGRVGTPEEIAAAALWLCSDAASFVTGHALVVDGGLVAQ